MNKRISLLLTLIISFICMNKVSASYNGASGSTFSGLSKNCSTKNCLYDNNNRLILQTRLYYIDNGSFTQIGNTVYYVDSNTYELLKGTDLYVLKLGSFDSLLNNADKYEEAKKKVPVGDVNEKGKALFKMITGMDNYEDILRKESYPYGRATKGYRLVYEPAFIVINPTFGTNKYGMITSRGKVIEELSGRSPKMTISSEEYKLRNRSADVGIPGRTEDQCKAALGIQYADLQYGCGYRMMDVDIYSNKNCYNKTLSNSGNTTCVNTDENNVSKYSESYTKTSTCNANNRTNSIYGAQKSSNGTCKLYCKEEALVSLPGNISNPQLRGSYFAWPSFGENTKYTMTIKSYMNCKILDEGGSAMTIASNISRKCPDGYVSYNETTCRSKTDKKSLKCPSDYPYEYNGKCYKGASVCPSGYQFIDSRCYKLENATLTNKLVKIKCTGTNVRFVDKYCYEVTPAKTEKLVDPKDKICPSGTYNVNGTCYASRRGRDWHQGSSYYESCDPCGTHYFGDATYCSQPSGWSAGTCSRCDKMSGTARTQCLKNCTPAHATCPSGWTPDNKVGANPACIKKASCSSCGGSLWSDGMCHIYKTNPGYYYCSSGVESGSYCYSDTRSKVCPSDHPIESNGKCYKKEKTAPYCDPGIGNHINDTARHLDDEGNVISLKGTCVGKQYQACPNATQVSFVENGKQKQRCEVSCPTGVSDTTKQNVKVCVSCNHVTSANTSASYHKFTTNPADWEQRHNDEYFKGNLNLQGKCHYDGKNANCDIKKIVNGKCITGTARDKVCDLGYIKVGNECYKQTNKILNYSCPNGYTITNNKLTCYKTCNLDNLNSSIEQMLKNNKMEAKLTAGDNKKIDEKLVVYSNTIEKKSDTSYVRTAKFKIAENKNRYFNRVTGAVSDSGSSSSMVFDRGQGVVSLNRYNDILEGNYTKDYLLKISNIKPGTSDDLGVKDYTCKFTITENNPPCVCPFGTINAGKKITDIESSFGIVLEKDLKCAGLIRKYCNYVPDHSTCKDTSTGEDVDITDCVKKEIQNNKTSVDAYEICKQKESRCTNDTCINVNTGAKVDIKQCLEDGNSRKVCEEKNCCTNTNSCNGKCTSNTKKLNGMIYKTTKCDGSCNSGNYCKFEAYCLNTNNTSRRTMSCLEEKLGVNNIVQALNNNEISLSLVEGAMNACKPVICEPGPIALFRVIDLSHPFPGISGADRKPGFNWDNEDLIKEKITNARDVEGIKLYQKEPLMTITLTPTDVKKIRDYNKNKSYSDFNLKCSNNIANCVSKFLHTKETIDLNIKYNSSCNLSITSSKELFDKCYNSNN